MTALHPFDLLAVFTVCVGLLPFGATINTALWIVAIIAIAVVARSGSVALRIGTKQERAPRNGASRRS